MRRNLRRCSSCGSTRDAYRSSAFSRAMGSSTFYIAGGIAGKIEEFLMQSPFRRRFEDKGRLTPYVAAIPTQLIVYPDIALLGAARSGIMLAPTAL